MLGKNVICEVINDNQLQEVDVFNGDVGYFIEEHPGNEESGFMVKFPHKEKPILLFTEEVNFIVK